MRPAAIDLFCGAGGLTAGLKQAGFRVVAAIDNDPLAVRTYKANHRKTRVLYKDIRAVDPPTLMSELGLKRNELDLLAGCPPCQGFSSMRTKNGHRDVEDSQNDLVFQWLRFVRAFGPHAVMLENVPGLGSDSRMKSVRAQLGDLGYSFADDILNVSNYGVPQSRRRFILIGLRSPEHKPRFGNTTEEPRTVRDAIGGLRPAGASGDPLHDIVERRSKRVLELIDSIPRNGGSRTDLPRSLQLRCHRSTDGWKDVYGRMAWNKPAPTITGGCVNPSKGRFLHPSENRAITLREAALLQSFPPLYTFSLDEGKFAAAQMIGNALPPAFVACHARALKGGLRALSG